MSATTTIEATSEASVESTPFDDAEARREGWVISGCGVDMSGLPRVELQSWTTRSRARARSLTIAMRGHTSRRKH